MFFTYDTGTITRPGKAFTPVKMGRTDTDGWVDFLTGGELLYRLGRTNGPAKGAGVFTVPMDHYQGGGPEAGHSGFGKSGVDSVGGAGFHTQTATLAKLEKLVFRDRSGWPDEIWVGYCMDIAVKTPEKGQ